MTRRSIAGKNTTFRDILSIPSSSLMTTITIPESLGWVLCSEWTGYVWIASLHKYSQWENSKVIIAPKDRTVRKREVAQVNDELNHVLHFCWCQHFSSTQYITNQACSQYHFRSQLGPWQIISLPLDKELSFNYGWPQTGMDVTKKRKIFWPYRDSTPDLPARSLVPIPTMLLCPPK